MLTRIPRSLSNQLHRLFSTSSCRNGQISNIGRAPIPLPPAATLTQGASSITVQGPLGTTEVPLKPYIRLDFSEAEKESRTLTVGVEDAVVKEQRQMWGTTRTLIHNAIVGMTEGFSVPLYLVGVGYRAVLEDDPRGIQRGFSGQRLNMKLGYSHSVMIPIPSHIKAEVLLPTKIMLSCTDKHLLGLFAAKVRSWRKPESYKGKGVFVGTEQIRIKTVKKK
ncbi:ribosomal protein L6 [Schizopora paradoxa]|uniref:Ribosomal protein L6 n=1 Tax=Schizopora paradoxa TaxID=27342 RepID=A0A0H2S3C8_9AGAM|nr:ribosomal protein L6 [Schizopora paradoxa]